MIPTGLSILDAMAVKRLVVSAFLLMSACKAGPAYLELGEARELLPPPGAEGPPAVVLTPTGGRTIAWHSVSDSAARRRVILVTDSAAPADLPQLVDGGAATATIPQLGIAPTGQLYAAYRAGGDTSVTPWRVLASADGGRSWQAPSTVGAVLSTSCACCVPTIAVGADPTWFVAMRTASDGDSSGVAVLASRDRGATWQPPVSLPTVGLTTVGCPGAPPAIRGAAEGLVHVAWWAGRSDSAGVYYARSTDGGQTFGGVIALGTGRFTEPAQVHVAVDGDSIVVVAWDDTRGPRARTTVRASRDGGRKFGPGLVMSDGEAEARFPAVAARNGEVTVTWLERRPVPGPSAPDSMSGANPRQQTSRVVMRTGRVR